MHGALVAWTFMEHEAFKPVTQLPWALAQGDIEANLRALQMADEATECTTWKIQRLLKDGNNFLEVVAGVQLLQEVGWSTASVEQAHASVTLVKRHHPDYDMPTLLIRAGLHTLRLLLPGIDEASKAVRRLQ